VKPLRFAVTPGEPAGIGPDLCLLLAAEPQPHPLIAITSRDLLAERATQLGLAVNLLAVAPGQWPDQPAPAGSLYVWDTPLAAPVVPGMLDKANAAFVLQTLTRAGQGCLEGHFAGMITAPVHKGVINESGIAFSGHTEFLAELTHTAQVVMMLATHGLRVALVTTHLPLRDIADAITPERLERVTRILHAATSSASPTHASWSAGSTRMPAKAATWAAKKSTSSNRHWPACAPKAWTCAARCRPIPCLPPNIWSTATRCWRCTTTKACLYSSTKVSALQST
jgi:4-hydroxy-L-threonine phosphate dehydrogenase PdxA